MIRSRPQGTVMSSAGNRGVLVVAAALALSGCIDNRMTLHSQMAAGAAAAPAGSKVVLREPSCEIQLIGIADHRPNAGEIPNTHGHYMHFDDMTGWLQAGLTSLVADGIAIRPKSSGELPRDKPRIDVELLKAYMQFIETSKSANVVVKVTFERPNEDPVVRLYRGRDTGVNWLHATAELSAAFDAALRDALQRMTPDLKGLCKSS